ncbi:MAG: YdiU family protein [Gammaproteobacteria bacterium]|nr:YdiU family protein [Gammaproteobacteria bacterium]
MSIAFDNSYIKLPQRFYSRQSPVPVSCPSLIAVNYALSEELGIDPVWLESDEGVEIIAGNRLANGSDPIATVYAGHQFGHWNPRLGDGRAVLLGEVIGSDGERYDIQLKGSGITPYSRNGDGRAPLGAILREYIVSEAMAALGVPNTRILAAVTTGDVVYREGRLDGAVLARVAKSHIRIGTLQYFASLDDTEALELLVDHAIERHYPQAKASRNPALSMFELVIQRIAGLIARWQSVGFIHGVMNTDNMLLSAETIDYGPCAFMDVFDSAALYSSIDHQRRYAYRNQPSISHWNLACLGQTLIPLLADEIETAMAQNALDKFPELYHLEYVRIFRQKLGLTSCQENDERLIEDYLNLLEAGKCDFTLAFRRLSELLIKACNIESLFDFPQAFGDWLARWQKRCAQENVSDEDRYRQMVSVNPTFIPRNHLVEEAIRLAYRGDYSLFYRLNDRLEKPFNYDSDDRDLAIPPRLDQIVQATFCGT